MDDERLGTLLKDAVAEVDPVDRLVEVRARARRSGARRRTRLLAGGTVAAAAAVAGAALLGDALTGRDRGRDDAAPEPLADVRVATYHLGSTDRGPRLFREVDQVPAASPLDAVLADLQEAPRDPDYRTPWPGAFEGAERRGDVVEVALADDSLRERPAGMGEAEAEVALQQVVHSVADAVRADVAVRFTLDGDPVDRLLGRSLPGPVERLPQNDVLALVSVTTPAEGARVPDRFVARGRANSFEATVPWEVRRGSEVVASGFATALGSMDRLYPWRARVDVSSLAPGTYTFVARVSDPSGGEGFAPDADTRTIVVE